MTVHLVRDRVWETCASELACGRLIHVPGLTPVEVRVLPEAFVDTLIEAVDPPTENIKGTRIWHDAMGGELHRENDLPALILIDGCRQWYRHGKLHRENDLPAVVWPDGSQMWYQHGFQHRENDLPALILADGCRQWYRHGKLHREDDLPAVVWPDGSQMWYQHGLQHRDNDLPATVLANGELHWFRHGRAHRLNGPARIQADGRELYAEDGAWFEPEAREAEGPCQRHI